MRRPGKGGDAKDDNSVFVTPDGGVTKVVKKEGEGPEVPARAYVTVHYILTLEDGTVVDSSRKRNSPFQFQVNTGQVILGWDKALRSMKKGELADIRIRSEYGYGTSGVGPIPPNATLFFEVEVLDVTMEPPTKALTIRVIQLVVVIAVLYAFFNYLYPRVQKSIG